MTQLASRRTDFARILPAIAAVASCILIATRYDYVPMWDGRTYTDCIFHAARNLAAAGALRCGGHASHAFVAFAAAMQQFSPNGDSYAMLLVTNSVLLVLAAVGMWRLARLAFPHPDHSLERTLLAASVLLQPALLAATVQPGIDLPLVPAFLWSAVFLIEGRSIPLVLVGTAMAFTKETGVLLYAALIGSHALRLLMDRQSEYGTWRHRIIRVIRLAPLAIPALVFVAYLMYRATLPQEQVLWNTSTVKQSMVEQLLIPRLDLYLIQYLAMILVLNFAWLPAGVLGVDALIGMLRRGQALPRRPVVGANTAVVGFLTLLLGVVIYCLTRFVTFGFVRYVLAAVALLPLVGYGALVRLQTPPLARRAALGGYVSLLLVSVVRTIDPVSRQLWGTFSVGDHTLLRMTSITGEPWGAGQEHLVYSLEFTRMLDAVDDALASVTAGPESMLVVPDSSHWIKDGDMFGPIDPSTHRRTLARPGTLRASVLTRTAVVDRGVRPRSAWFIAVPNGAQASETLHDLERFYTIGPERRIGRGYTVSVYALSRLSP
jgi:hypothetical protein